jgi:hypothetical protein
MLNFKIFAQGVSPLPLWLSGCDNSRTCATSASLRAGVVWGDRHYPLLRRVGILNFISMEKEFYRAKNCKKSIISPRGSQSMGSFKVQFMNEFIQRPETGKNIRRMIKMCISGCVHLRSMILGKIAKEKNDKMGIF